MIYLPSNLKILKMKKLSLAFSLFILAAIAVSCSSDDTSTNNTGAALFKVTIDGTEFIGTTITTLRHDGLIEIVAQNNSNERVDLAFTETGFLRTLSYINLNTFDTYNFLYYHPNRFCAFSIASLTGSNVSATFSGNLYTDDLDISTPNIVFTDGQIQNISLTDLGNTSTTTNYLNGTVNSNYWEVTQHGNSLSSGYTISGGNGFDSQQINIKIPSNVTTGTFNYTDASALKVIYDVYEEYPINDFSYNNSGSITITEVTDLPFGYKQVTGTFNHTSSEGSGGTSISIPDGGFSLTLEFL